MRDLPFFSIILPTYNRSFWLNKCIVSLKEQRYPPSLYEIIIVDNGSTDDTRKVTEKYLTSDNPSIRYIYESRPGSNFARNIGAFHSRGDILAFIDDDAYADPCWLYWLAQTFLDNNNIIVVSGRIELDWEIPKPVWFPEEYESYLGSNSRQGSQKREIQFSEPVFEGNLAIQRSKFDLEKGFDTQFGMVANSIGTNDGTILIDRLRRLGKVIYQPEAIVYHYVPKSKIQPSYFLKRGYYQGIGDAKVNQTRRKRNKFGLIRAIANDFLVLGCELFDLLISLVKNSRSQSLEKLIKILNRLGAMKQRFLLVLAKQ